MAGNKAGGKKAAKTNIERHGEDFYKIVGAKGGRSGHTGGFYSDKVGEDGLTGRERAVIAGRKGGLKSKRGPAKPKDKPKKKGIVERIFRRKDAYQEIRIELKRKKGGVVSEAQKRWGNVYELAGIPCKVCKGADEAIAFVQQVMREIEGEE